MFQAEKNKKLVDVQARSLEVLEQVPAVGNGLPQVALAATNFATHPSRPWKSYHLLRDTLLIQPWTIC